MILRFPFPDDVDNIRAALMRNLERDADADSTTIGASARALGAFGMAVNAAADANRVAVGAGICRDYSTTYSPARPSLN